VSSSSRSVDEEARRLAEEIVVIVEREKGSSPPPPQQQQQQQQPLSVSPPEIRENSDFWHCSPALPAVYGQRVPSPLRQPLPSQIQKAYALTPNAYGHGTPLSAHPELTAMAAAAVEALVIAAPAQPASGQREAVRMLSDFEPFRAGYGLRRPPEVPPRHSKPKTRAVPRHRAEAIRESDVPPRFRRRRRKNGSDAASSWTLSSK